ncbi:MAG: Ig-like domain-containing domain [Candidatus Latescibacterota bacterium]
MRSVVIVFLFLPASLLAVEAFAADYYPLHAGDVRYLDRIPYSIGNEQTVNGVSYFPVFHGNFSYFCRKDASGNVYWKLPGKEEVLVYDFTADAGQSWKCTLGHNEYTVTLTSKTETVRTAFGEFSGCYTFSFKAPPNIYDADYADYFAPDVGLVQRGTCWQNIGPLIKASIGGHRIPAEGPHPVLDRTWPEDEKSDVPVDNVIRLFLSLNIQPSSVSAEMFRVTSRKKGAVAGTIVPSDSAHTHTITFRPDQPFSRDDIINVTIYPGVRDYLGDLLGESYHFAFSTGAFTAVSDFEIPQYRLDNHPNPFNPSTTISFTLPEPAAVNLSFIPSPAKRSARSCHGA